MNETPMTPEQRATLTNQVGSGAPAATALVFTLAEAVRDRREHQHEPRDDRYCANLTAWLGERMAPVLRRLAEAEAEAERLRAERDRYRIAWRGARTRALSTAGVADRAVARREALQRVADDLLEQALTAQMQRDELRAELATRPSRTELLNDAADAIDGDSSISAAVHATAALRRMAGSTEAGEKGTQQGKPTPDFFQPGRTYCDGNGYTAPELTMIFRVEHVTRHPSRGTPRAIGWSRAGSPDSRWHGDFRDEFEGWHEMTQDGESA
ncbi:hypothetical protein [Streptomyces sp. NPDC007083]|uniref:hypothetical protein n=1 Tax=Streptomyces sp. NPDC007083 TaxID=3156913 RepID=UPI0033CDA3ED